MYNTSSKIRSILIIYLVILNYSLPKLSVQIILLINIKGVFGFFKIILDTSL